MAEVIEFNFTEKTETYVSLESLSANYNSECYYWINLDREEAGNAVPIFQNFCKSPQIESELISYGKKNQFNINQSFLSFTISEPYFSDRDFINKSIQVILGKSFMATISDGKSAAIKKMKETYHEDFVNFSKSPSFLLFEEIDHLSILYQDTYRVFEEEISNLQIKLFDQTDEDIFKGVAQITRQLVSFRSALLSARDIVNILASRKSAFISETTQPFLERKETLLEGLSHDLADQRAALSDTLNLYMGFVSYRTNKVINRLTVISIIFLPLTFLVGIYGMNFEHMPELGWKYSYPLFWLVAVTIVICAVWFIKRMKWL